MGAGDPGLRDEAGIAVGRFHDALCRSEPIIRCTSRCLADGNAAALELSAAFIDDAFGKGDVCEAILFNGKIVSFRWAASSTTHDQDGVFVTFDDRHRYVYFAYTLEEFRGQHLPRVFTPVKDRYWIARGRTHSIAYVAVDNRSSILATLASGCTRIGFAAYLKRGRWFLSFRTPGARAHGFRFFVPPGGGAGR